jgi:sorbitol/mannitol transport system permease protein
MSQTTTSETSISKGRNVPAQPPPPAPGGGNAVSANPYDTPARRRLPLLPALVFVIVLTQVPFVATLVISFIEWNGLRPEDRNFAGLDNYREVFSDPDLRSAVVTTVILTVVVVLASLLIGFGLALLLNRKFFGRGFLRTLLITPFLIVPVASALLWKHLLLNPTTGLINGVLTWLGDLLSFAPPQIDLISSNPLIAVEIALIWQWTPFMMLILLAGLQSLPGDAMEAAQIDGASSWQTFVHIILPHMRQYLELGGLLGAIYVVQAFDAVFTITGGAEGASNLPYAIYQEFFVAQDYGVSSAMGVITVLGTLVIATFALRTVSTLLREENR